MGDTTPEGGSQEGKMDWALRQEEAGLEAICEAWAKNVTVFHPCLDNLLEASF